MKIGNSELIRNIDNYCINDLGIPSIVLMENAALKVIKNIDFQKFKSFTIVCGTGNNGGDGLAVARQLFSMNMKIDVFIVGNHSMSKDCFANYNILKNIGIDIKHIITSEDMINLREALLENDMAIDAIFGVGLTRKIEGIYEEVIKSINKSNSYIMAIDIPSGMKCDSFGILGTSIEANKTISFEVYKKGFLDYEGEKYTGTIIVEKIGVQKSKESIDSADLVIIVLDSSKPLTDEDLEILENAKSKKTIVLLNKIDLEQAIDQTVIEEIVGKDNIIKISALKNEGIEQIHDKIESMVFAGDVKNSSNLVITNSRHKDALFKAYNSINDAIAGIDQRLPYDFIEVDFKNIWDYLGYINGDTVQEDLLDTIFSNFCIGK